MGALIEASKEGRLSDRGNPEQFQGAFAEIVRGVNTMLDRSFCYRRRQSHSRSISNGKIDELSPTTRRSQKMKVAVNNVAVVTQGLQRKWRG